MFKMIQEEVRKEMNRVRFFIIISIIALSASCVVAVMDGRYPESSWYPKSEYQRTLALKSGGTLSLENVNGNIKIQGWDEEKVEITAVEKRGYLRSPKFYIYGAHSLEPKIDLQTSDDMISIKTSSAGKEEEFRLVNYDMRVPRSIKLKNIRNGQGNIQITDIFGSVQINQEEGDITMKNFSGSLDIALGSGSIEAELLDVRSEDEVRIKTEQGDIVLYLEPRVEAQLEANAPDGDISSEIDLKQPLPAKRASAKLGEGKATILLISLRGDIKIKKVEE
jgi:DUF4097 and DUF4098 domain-containing protein YvlB